MDKYTIEEQQYRNGYNAGYVDAIREMIGVKSGCNNFINKRLDSELVEIVTEINKNE
jgi:hypothetical protein